MIVIKYTRRQLAENSSIIAAKSTSMIRSLQEGLGGVRDVLIDGSQEFYCDVYRNSDRPLRRAAGLNAFIAGSPRFLMEAIGMTLIAGLAFVMSSEENGFVTAIPTLGALALGAQRLLPALQSAYGAYSNIQGSQSSFYDVLELLDQPLPRKTTESPLKRMEFTNNICFKNLSFKYGKNDKWVLDNIDLVLAKGSRVGFVGKTGSGKSTLLDIFMGLLLPSEGQVIIDKHILTSENRSSWQANIAHVPQNIYLSDNSIRENIAFGVDEDEIDDGRVKKAADQAQISELIESLPQQYNTFVGERGARLSGGQRQRIGIARALYKNASVLVLDEATSALDNETESEVMRNLDFLDRDITVLIIAHRLSTLEGCDHVIKVDNGSATLSSDHKVYGR